MEKVHTLDALPPRAQGLVLSIGAYDGVHLGHQRILKQTVGAAARRKMSSVVLSFAPHPQKVIAPDTAPPLLQTQLQRERMLESLGIEFLAEIPFTRRLSQLSPRQFVEEVLMRRQVHEIHVGSNFRFGHRRSGDVRALRELGNEFGFDVFAVEPVRLRGVRISSSKIRRLLGEGNAQLARRYLGRPYEIRGTVVQGDQRGREMGFPTLNLHTENELIPKVGVYVGRAELEGKRYGCVTNVGYRPTVRADYAGRPVVESHLFDFDKDAYGLPVHLDFCLRLRDEKRFGGLQDLIRRIRKDSRRARRYLGYVRDRLGEPV